MPRRTGKAATRRARQQRRARQGPNPAAAVPAPASEPVVAEPRAEQAAAPASPSRPAVAYASASSNLGESGRHEYHYVMRDLRNSAILVVIMAALLVVAVVIVNLAGNAPS